MALERVSFPTREDWLEGRRELHGIGGSEAAAAAGLSPWMTPLELWKLKIGVAEAKDLSGNAAVEQGVRLEPALRGLFAARHPELAVEHHPFDMLYQTERPWLFATLDGELRTEERIATPVCGLARNDRNSGGAEEAPPGEAVRRGVLEIKTATPNGRAGWAAWSDGQMPQHYYAQVLHQLLATGFDFVFLFAALFSMSGDITIREYEIDRTDVADDLAWLLAKETEFWDYVRRGVMPPMPLRL